MCGGYQEAVAAQQDAERTGAEIVSRVAAAAKRAQQ
jgi:hypothetical protein